MKKYQSVGELKHWQKKRLTLFNIFLLSIIYPLSAASHYYSTSSLAFPLALASVYFSPDYKQILCSVPESDLIPGLPGSYLPQTRLWVNPESYPEPERTKLIINQQYIKPSECRFRTRQAPKDGNSSDNGSQYSDSGAGVNTGLSGMTTTGGAGSAACGSSGSGGDEDEDEGGNPHPYLDPHPLSLNFSCLDLNVYLVAVSMVIGYYESENNLGEKQRLLSTLNDFPTISKWFPSVQALLKENLSNLRMLTNSLPEEDQTSIKDFLIELPHIKEAIIGFLYPESLPI